MLNLIKQYKWYVIFLGFISWTVGVSYIVNGFAHRSIAEDKLELVQRTLEQVQKSTDVKEAVSKAFQENLSFITPKITTINKEIHREIQQNSVYTDCRTTDGVLRQYEQKLDLQQTK